MLNKLFALIKKLLTQGATPHGLALSCAMGSVLGLFPIIGTTTALCLLVGTLMRLNQPLMQAINYLLYPLHLLSIPLFVYFGESMFGADKVSFNPEEMLRIFKTDFKLFWANFGMIIIYAIVAWLIVAPFLAAAIYFSVKPILQKLKSAQQP